MNLRDNVISIHQIDKEPIIKDFEGPLVLIPGKIEDYLEIITLKKINRDDFHRKEHIDINILKLIDVFGF